jgi:hypothetical protein
LHKLGKSLETKIRKENLLNRLRESVKQLPDEQTRAELLALGKSLEAQARKVYLMAEGLAQKYEHKLQLLQQTNERQ